MTLKDNVANQINVLENIAFILMWQTRLMFDINMTLKDNVVNQINV
jgi:hypothetical protein